MIERINSHLVVPISDLIEYAMSYGNVEALKYHTLKCSNRSYDKKH